MDRTDDLSGRLQNQDETMPEPTPSNTTDQPNNERTGEAGSSYVSKASEFTEDIAVSDSGLNLKQSRFVDAYLHNGNNGTRAAIVAGYAPRSAHQAAADLLRNPLVAAEISRERDRLRQAARVELDDLVQSLQRVAGANILDYVRLTDDGEPFVDWTLMTREQAAAVAEVTVEDFTDGRGEDARNVRRVRFKLKDSIRATELLAKLLGYLVERHEVKDVTVKTVQQMRRLSPDELAEVSRKYGEILAIYNRQPAVLTGETIDAER